MRSWVFWGALGVVVGESIEIPGSDWVPPETEISTTFQHPMVLLRHTVAAQPGAGDDHFDLMIQEGSDPASPLRSWRVWVDVSTLRTGDHFIAEPTPNHRAAYLTYEGPVSGDRGTVQRISMGSAVIWDEGTHLHIMTRWADGSFQRLLGRRVDDRAWRFEVV